MEHCDRADLVPAPLNVSAMVTCPLATIVSLTGAIANWAFTGSAIDATGIDCLTGAFVSPDRQSKLR